MCVHDDGTMDVLVNGKIERRKYTACYAREPGYSRHDVVEQPEHNSDTEVVLWYAGRDIPEIIRTRNAQ